ncbi:NUDIX domain-containing protein [Wenyingzhuangia sp. IMCC45574]
MNQHLKIKEIELLSDDYHTLNKVNYHFLNQKNEWEATSRESYDKGNGSTIILYNLETKNIILTRQLRVPTHFNGNEGGMLIEACAGGVENGEDPSTSIVRETEEETGYRVKNVERIFHSYMSPGSVTEILFFFIAAYDENMKVSSGGGLQEETENIEVLEIKFEEAYNMIGKEILDAKTILLLQHLKIHIF